FGEVRTQQSVNGPAVANALFQFAVKLDVFAKSHQEIGKVATFQLLVTATKLHSVVLRGAPQDLPAEFLLVANVAGALAFLDQIKRRLRDLNVAALHQLRHLAKEKGEQKGANVRAVHIRVGHDDDLAIAE